jgi:hypothetical protein
MLNGLLVVPNFGFPPLVTRPPLRNVIEWTALHSTAAQSINSQLLNFQLRKASG